MHTFHCGCRCSCGSHIEWDGSWEMLGAGLAKGYGSRRGRSTFQTTSPAKDRKGYAG